MKSKIHIDVLSYGIPHVDEKGKLHRKPHILRVTGPGKTERTIELNPNIEPRKYKKTLRALYPGTKITITGRKTTSEVLIHNLWNQLKPQVLVANIGLFIENHHRPILFTLDKGALKPTMRTLLTNWLLRKSVNKRYSK